MIYSRLAPSEDYSSSTNSHLKTFAVNGLRTLCVAERTIGLVDYEVQFNLSVCLCVWCVCVCACVCLSLPPPLLSNLHVSNGVNGGVITYTLHPPYSVCLLPQRTHQNHMYHVCMQLQQSIQHVLCMQRWLLYVNVERNLHVKWI